MDSGGKIKGLLDDAGIRTTEIAALLGVHRVSVSRWINEKLQPNKFLRPAIIDLLSRVEQAVKDGSLPLPEGVRGKERMPALRRTLKL